MVKEVFPSAREVLDYHHCAERLHTVAGVQWGAEEAQQAVEDLGGYLEANQQRVNYGGHRRGGYPLGSGAIESGHRFISHVRLRGSGAWWYVERDNGMLALRCAKYNGTFKRVFERYMRRERERKWGRYANSA